MNDVYVVQERQGNSWFDLCRYEVLVDAINDIEYRRYEYYKHNSNTTESALDYYRIVKRHDEVILCRLI